MRDEIDSILEFWFGEATGAAEVAAEKSALWWSKNDEVDREIIDRFGDLPEAAVNGGLDHWKGAARGELALIICTDQFPRNMFRNSPGSFQFDACARELARTLVETGRDQQLGPIERVFAYLPCEHSEDLEDQRRSLALYRNLVESVDAGERELFRGYLDFAVKHHDIVARFGRFPHRNRILGRTSSDEETAFLQQPGSSF